MPTARDHGTAAVYNGKIYVMGGEGGQPAQQQPLAVVEAYDPAANTWASGLAPLPSPQRFIGWSGTATLNGILYITAGTLVYGYDPQTNTWTTFNPLPVAAGGTTVALNGALYVLAPQHTLQGTPAPQGNLTWVEKAPMPVAVSAFGYAVLGDKIYVIGGNSGGVDTTAVQRYTPAGNSWEVDTGHGGSLAPLPAPRSFGFFCEVLSSKIHCMGGWQNGTYKGDHYIYDPASNTWTSGPALPQYPIGQFATVANNKIYVFGGWGGSYQTTVYEYSEATGWATKASMPTARDHGTAAVYNGKIYVMGGEGGQPAQQLPLAVVEAYDPAANTWASGLAPLPSPQRFIGWSGTATLNGIFYITAGTLVYGYDPQTNTWTTFNPLPVAAGGTTVALNGALYVLAPQHTLTTASATCFALNTSVNPAGSGSVDANPAPNCGAGYTPGTAVQLTAHANPGYGFANWSGDASGNNNPASITLNGNMSVAANFNSQSDVTISGVRITNLRDTTFTVSWITSRVATGQVRFGTNPANLDQNAYDTRGNVTVDDTHYVVLANLTPGATYYFDVVSDGRVEDKGGSHYSAVTGLTLAVPAPDTAFGKVFKLDGSTFAVGAIAYVRVRDNNGQGSPGQSAWLSALVDDTGFWYLNLAQARTAGGDSYFSYSSSGDKVEVEVEGAADCRASFATDTGTDSPTPDATLACLIETTRLLGAGWNLPALSVQPQTPLKAQSLLDAVAAQGGNCAEIDRWRNGGWDAHINGLPFNDFDITLGQGYFLKCSGTVTWRLQGYEVTAPLPLALQAGWNLLAVPYPTSGHTAQSLLDAITAQGGSCGEIDRWLNGGWDAHVGGLPFNNFAIQPDGGYFVKCSQASTFTPPAALAQSSHSAQLLAPAEAVAEVEAASPASVSAIKNVRITDVRDSSFVVSWTTDQVSPGSITYGMSTALGSVATDALNPTPTAAHYVAISGLSQNTTYYFDVIAGALTDDNGGAHYTVTTGPTLGAAPGTTIYGQVFGPGGTGLDNAIVYLQVARAVGNSQSAAVRTAGGGWWSYNLDNLRTADGQAKFNPVAGETLKITAEAGASGSAGVTAHVPVATGAVGNITLSSPTAISMVHFAARPAAMAVGLPLLAVELFGSAGLLLWRRRRQGARR